MPDEPIEGVKFSQFSSETPGSSDEVVGLHAGNNARFSVANFVLAVRQGLANLFVPLTRKVNNKALSADITLTMDDIQNGTTYSKTTAAQVAQIGTNETDIDTIEGKIPSAASTSNQLADKAFVTDSITQGTAIFRGSFATKAALLAVAWQTSDPNASYYVSNNDYAVVLADETQNNECWRYIYVTGTGWTPQYRINESPMTQAQLDALNSGATASIINSVADKLDKTGDGKDVTATFSTASTRANISTGEKLSVMFGKIAKWFTDFGTAAFAAISTSTPNMDGTGAAGSTGDVSDAGHTHPSDTSRVPVYGMGKNLLDNAYFIGGGSQLGDGVFPINQREQASYNTDGYVLDRWQFNSYSYGTLTLTSGGLQIAKNGATSNPGLRQDMEHDLDGQIVTFSALDNAGNLYTFTSGTLDNTVSGWQASNNFGAIWVGIRYISGKWSISVTTTGITLAALKLEFGTQSTLTHTENGTTVIAVLPDFWVELANAQRYLKVVTAWRDLYAARVDNSNLSFFIPGHMVKAPTALSSQQIIYYSASTGNVTGNISFTSVPGGVYGYVSRGSLSANTGGSVVFPATVYISAEQ